MTELKIVLPNSSDIELQPGSYTIDVVVDKDNITVLCDVVPQSTADGEYS